MPLPNNREYSTVQYVSLGWGVPVLICGITAGSSFHKYTVNGEKRLSRISPLSIANFSAQMHLYNVLLGDPEVTANLYCSFAYLYWEGCDICSIYLRPILGHPLDSWIDSKLPNACKKVSYYQHTSYLRFSLNTYIIIYITYFVYTISVSILILYLYINILIIFWLISYVFTILSSLYCTYNMISKTIQYIIYNHRIVN